MQFKIGDRVQFKGTKGGNIWEGVVGTVSEVPEGCHTDKYCVWVKIDEGSYYYGKRGNPVAKEFIETGISISIENLEIFREKPSAASYASIALFGIF